MHDSPDPTQPQPSHASPSARFPIACPHCKAEYLVRPLLAGRRLRCHHCGHVWREQSLAILGVAGALDHAASAWTELGSTMHAAADHASTIGSLVEKTAAPKAPAGDFVGRRIGRYEIKAVLGQGAMGYVYEALDSGLMRHVALKLLPRRIDPDHAPVGLKLFLQEAQVAARLQHPGIVTIYEIGHDAGHYYFAMELVDGATLYALVHERGPLPVRQACYVIAHAARALAAAHAQGVVHRDVKPGNILINKAGQVKVTDFGLADVEGVEGLEELSGRILGTPGWISPEVARGQPATPASDIYGLGLTLFYALSHKRLIHADSKSGMIRQQQTARSIRREELPRGWPPRLSDAVVQALQADPANRYQSAEMLAADLLRAMVPDDRDGTIVLEAPTPALAAPTTPSRPKQSNAFRIVLFVVIAAAALAGLTAAYYFLFPRTG